VILQRRLLRRSEIGDRVDGPPAVNVWFRFCFRSSCLVAMANHLSR
jgi:hypothetical protein